MKGKVAGVVVDRLGEDLGVGHRDDGAGELATLHPHGGVGALDARRLAHPHDGGLDEAEPKHVAHGDAVADVEGRAAQDHEVAGHRRDHLLQRNARPADTSPNAVASRVGSLNQIDMTPRMIAIADSRLTP